MNIDTMLDKLADTLRPIVAAIEASPATTQDHYGDYMAAIDRVARKLGTPTQTICVAIGIALQRAGAPRSGVQSALRAMGHL